MSDWRDGCPVCFAPPTDACTTPSGKPRNDHAARPRMTPNLEPPRDSGEADAVHGPTALGTHRNIGTQASPPGSD